MMRVVRLIAGRVDWAKAASGRMEKGKGRW
jgi:hypothetical protein